MKKILIILLVLSSCQSYRAERKINKLREWGYMSDSTITKYDTIRGFSHDSIYFFDTTTLTDTINTFKNGIKVVTVIKWKERQVKQILTQNDTIFKHKYTTKVIKQPIKWWNRFKVGVWFCSILLLLYLLSINYIQKQLNK
jgi:hypothetical protein